MLGARWVYNPLYSADSPTPPPVPRNVQVVGSVTKRGISGGQRKRVNIGMELVLEPSLVFMDEPTSGLDAAGAQDVMAHMTTCCSRWGEGQRLRGGGAGLAESTLTSP
jgi:hypothetical protein